MIDEAVTSGPRLGVRSLDDLSPYVDALPPC